MTPPQPIPALYQEGGRGPGIGYQLCQLPDILTLCPSLIIYKTKLILVPTSSFEKAMSHFED